ncbi:molybdenum ABC transporter permease [Xylanibacillus composti]|uniref:Molybdenum transport system permease n=1 Tax=Xylanibacillus composti TaxID=1572762 RepID=A0A8J4H6Y8_9BACL|nr:ABC transporter permease [Xylanibacillus composti]GIQ69648.1 molybdenum ABC transporter permease [Xylanibacillus composti]
MARVMRSMIHRLLIPQASLSLVPVGYSVVFFLLSTLIVAFLCLPIIGLFTSITTEHLYAAFRSPHLSYGLALSLFTSIISIGIIVLLGTPLAYMLARSSFRGKQLLEVLVDLPMVIPPSVAGIGLILAFGRKGLIGSWLAEHGIVISFTVVAVIFAQVFIAAPFYIRSAKEGFKHDGKEMEAMARSLGASWWRSFYRVSLPLARPYLISGMLTSWARALGEFGATIMFAGNFLGKTETLPLAIYSAMNEDLGVAIVLANLLLVMSLLLMATVRLLAVERR